MDNNMKTNKVYNPVDRLLNLPKEDIFLVNNIPTIEKAFCISGMNTSAVKYIPEQVVRQTVMEIESIYIGKIEEFRERLRQYEPDAKDLQGDYSPVKTIQEREIPEKNIQNDNVKKLTPKEEAINGQGKQTKPETK